MEKLKVETFKFKYLKELKKIYNESFPKNEKFPIIILLLNVIRGNSEIFLLLNNEKVIAFIYFINYKKSSFILYLAVNSYQRNKGYGSYLLNSYCKSKLDNTIYLNIDEVNDKFSDNDLRKKRLEFYLLNKFYDTGYISVEKCGNFNILSTNKKFNLREYVELDKIISKWFFYRKAKIVEDVNE